MAAVAIAKWLANEEYEVQRKVLDGLEEWAQTQSPETFTAIDLNGAKAVLDDLLREAKRQEQPETEGGPDETAAQSEDEPDTGPEND